MILLDSCAILALLRGEPAAAQVGSMMREGGAVTTTVAVAEVVDRLARLDGVDPGEAALDLAELDLMPAVAFGWELAVRAGALRARGYDRMRCSVSLADCVAAETARAFDLALATADPHLLALCREEGIDITPLPDSRGRTWSG